MKGKLKIIRGAICVLFALMWAVLLFAPLPASVAARTQEYYRCVWADGTETEESYFSAYLSLMGLEGDVLVLGRAGELGTIAAGDACIAAAKILEAGEFGELMVLGTEGLTRLECAALYRRYSGRLWYAGEFFQWTGDAFSRTSAYEAREIVLLDGSISASRLAAAGATRLYVHGGAAFEKEMLEGTAVEEVVAAPPYLSAGNTVCLSTPGGVRLLAGMPTAKSITVPDSVYFADEGALLACTELEEITLPFAGSAKSPAGSAYRGEFAHLFSTGKEYKVPQTLRKVRVTGGYLTSHAFYTCRMIEEIDACGVASEQIEAEAFVDCTSLRTLHTPRADVTLRGTFTARALPCGCTLYERAE